MPSVTDTLSGLLRLPHGQIRLARSSGPIFLLVATVRRVRAEWEGAAEAALVAVCLVSPTQQQQVLRGAIGAQ